MGSINAYKAHVGVGKQAGAVLLRDALVPRDRFSNFYEAEFIPDRRVDEERTSARAELEEVGLDEYDLRLRGVMEGSTEGILTRLLYSLLGGKASAQQGATAAYKHTLTVADTVPVDARLSFEKKLGTMSAAEAANGIVREVTLDFTRAGFLRIGFEALCGKHEEVSPTAATLPARTTLLTRRGAGQTGGLMTIAGEASTRVRGGTITLRRALEEDDFDLLSQFRADAEYGDVMATFNVSLGFRDNKFMKLFWGSAAAVAPSDESAYYNTQIAFARPDVIASTFRHLLQVNMPRVFLKPPSRPLRGAQFITQQVEGIAVYKSADSKAVDVEVTNTQTTV